MLKFSALLLRGDVKTARAEILAGNEALIDEFFDFEYTMNGFIASYPKPYITLASGVIMGVAWACLRTDLTWLSPKMRSLQCRR